MLREENGVLIDLVGFQGFRVQGIRTTRLVKKSESMPALTNLTIESKFGKEKNGLTLYTRTELDAFPFGFKPNESEPTLAEFFVYVPHDLLVSLTPPTANLAYSSWSWTGKPTMGSTYSAYKFQGFVEGPSGYIGLIFAEDRTGSIANTAVKTWYSQENYHWPRIIESLLFYCTDVARDYPTWDQSYTGGVSFSPTGMSVQKKIRESFSGLTTLKYEKFISSVEWSKAYLEADGTEKPQPGIVDWDCPGSTGQEADVLHGELWVPRSYFASGGGHLQPVNADAGTPTPSGATAVTSIEPKHYAATNQTTWVTHVASNEVKERGYYFERLKVTAYVPPMPTIWS